MLPNYISKQRQMCPAFLYPAALDTRLEAIKWLWSSFGLPGVLQKCQRVLSSISLALKCTVQLMSHAEGNTFKTRLLFLQESLSVSNIFFVGREENSQTQNRQLHGRKVKESMVEVSHGTWKLYFLLGSRNINVYAYIPNSLIPFRISKGGSEA